MKKFAYLVHLPNGYRKDFSKLSAPLGLVPDFLYKAFMYSLPLKPYIWSEVKVSPISAEADGYVIMLPYTGKQLIEQQWQAQPMIERAVRLAADKGASIVGLGPLFSSITMRGRLLANNPYTGITNGSAFTAVSVFQKIEQLIQDKQGRPRIAIVGATGSVGNLVSLLLASAGIDNCLLLARNFRRLSNLSNAMRLENPDAKPSVSVEIKDIKDADIVVVLTSSGETVLQAKHLKQGAIILDATQPRSIGRGLLRQRPDITLLDAGIVSSPALHFSQPDITLPKGISYSSLAETILLAQAGHDGDFCLGSPSLADAQYINQLCTDHRRLGFSLAPDHAFGQPLAHIPVEEPLQEAFPQPAFKLA